MSSISEMMNEKGTPAIKKLALCVPMRGKVACVFMQSYLALFIHLLKKKGIVAQPIFSDTMPLDKARCSLAKSAILNKCDYALWMDADIVMNENQFEQMWKTLHEKDGTEDERFIVTGIYYEREQPYDAVIRHRNDIGVYEKIMQFPEDKPFTVDGMGFGFVLMKAKPLQHIFSATKGYPFRWTDKVSEDLYFCDVIGGADCADFHLKDEKGETVSYKIWCDPKVQVPHHGSYVTQWHYLHYKLDEYSEIQEIARYKKLKSEDAYQACCHGALNMAKAWQERFGKDRNEKDLPEADVLEFYRNTDLYLYDLTWWWSHSKSQREAVMNSWKKDAHRTLDFGCGIGDYGLYFATEYQDAKVDFYDINKENVAYLKHRIEVREVQTIIPKGNCRVIDEGGLIDTPEKYDQIFCLDVLEHIKNPEETTARLKKMLKKDGILIAQVSPKGAFQPQHISEIDLSQHGFLQIDALKYVRDDSDMALNYAKIVNGIKGNMTSVPMKR